MSILTRNLLNSWQACEPLFLPAFFNRTDINRRKFIRDIRVYEIKCLRLKPSAIYLDYVVIVEVLNLIEFIFFIVHDIDVSRDECNVAYARSS